MSRNWGLAHIGIGAKVDGTDIVIMNYSRFCCRMMIFLLCKLKTEMENGFTLTQFLYLHINMMVLMSTGDICN